MEMFNSHLQGAKSEPITVATAVSHATGICYLASSSVNSIGDCWIIDSGASRHICHIRDLSCNWHRIEPICVVLPTAYQICVEFVGDVRISTDLILHDVLYVPDFAYNLVSVSCLLQTGLFSVLFAESYCLI